MNQIAGEVTGVEAHGSVAIMDVAAGHVQLTATLLGNPQQLAAWTIGQPVVLLFKETEVALAKNLSGDISLRNRLPGYIVSIEMGQVLTRVHLLLAAADGSCPVQTEGVAKADNALVQVSSVITTRSAKKLLLTVGDKVEALVKSNEMSVLPRPDVAGMIAI
ncbi:TOBE domain-containing protein [Undibacterium sp. SXout7W]|uniref:TOBE domain-containing protein n=1 Tax=Undibacterium sp. SXout7W TaxID=3413049 RepID=UPI003BF440D8